MNLQAREHLQTAEFNTWYRMPALYKPEKRYNFVIDIGPKVAMYYGILIVMRGRQKSFSIFANYSNPSNWTAYKMPRADIKAVTHDIMPDIKRQFIKKLF